MAKGKKQKKGISSGVKKTFLVFSIGILFLSLAPILVSAEEGLVPCDLTGPNACTFCDFFVLIDNIIDAIMFQTVPILAALMIAIGGVMYMLAYFGQGGPEKLAQVKRLFGAIAIGLLIIYGAWVIINTFFMLVGVQEWTGLREGWSIINCN